jgi:hypothetical protein
VEGAGGRNSARSRRLGEAPPEKTARNPMSMTPLRSKIVIGIGLFLATAANGAAQYCAFDVRVSSPAGTPLDGIPVAVIQQNGKEFGSEVRTDTLGLAKLCDSPMGRVSIIVGLDICGLVTIRNISPSWPDTKQLRVTYKPEHCNHFGPAAPSCTILLRILDNDARPIPDAMWKPEGKSGRSTSSDEFGRIFQSVDVGRVLLGILTGHGFAPINVSVPCVADGERLIEKKITLRTER